MERYLGHTCGDRVQTVKEHLEGTAVLSLGICSLRTRIV